MEIFLMLNFNILSYVDNPIQILLVLTKDTIKHAVLDIAKVKGKVVVYGKAAG